jgi:hypothetical protein
MIIDYRVESKDKKALMAPFLIPIREENSFDLIFRKYGADHFRILNQNYMAQTIFEY